jgi:hypothetical protein
LGKALMLRPKVARAALILFWIYPAYYATISLSILISESNIEVNYSLSINKVIIFIYSNTPMLASGMVTKTDLT